MKGADGCPASSEMASACWTTCRSRHCHVDLMSPSVQRSLGSELPIGRRQLRKKLSHQGGDIHQCPLRSDGMRKRKAESQGEP